MDRKYGKYVVMEQSGNQPMSIGGTTVVCSDSSVLFSIIIQL